jgi:iron uptake system component EfeO
MHLNLVRALLCAGAFGALALTVAACGSSEETTTAEVAERVTNPKVEAVVADYRGYLQQNADELVATTKPFVAAVVAGNLAEAKSLYAAPRIPYERIEPVADSFGALDPKIDARENDVAAADFEGFHRIEKALWEEGTTAGMAPVAKQLQVDVEALAGKVEGVELRPVQIAEGANGLLGEVSASKITGEEERYSHIDVVDFEANVEGSEVAFETVKPLLDETDPDLAAEVESHFRAVFNSLQPYRTADGFIPYTELTKADTRKLAREIDALAEELSQVPAAVASSEKG